MNKRGSNCTLVLLGTVLIGIALIGTAIVAHANIDSDIDSSWHAYMNGQKALEPAYRFPSSTCFTVAAL